MYAIRSYYDWVHAAFGYFFSNNEEHAAHEVGFFPPAFLRGLRALCDNITSENNSDDQA